ncbi:RNase Sy, partial [Absidia repens]
DALSCSTTAGGSCCSPTNGVVVLTQQWYEGLGPQDYFTMHGLWPNMCNGGRTPEEGCDPSRNYGDLDPILRRNQSLYNEMSTYWPSFKGSDRNAEFWSHEWITHGTCITTLERQCFSNFQEYQDLFTYFNTALGLHQQYDLYAILSDANITPGGSYSLDQFESAVRAYTGFTPMITCKEGSTLNEIRIYFKVRNGDQYEPTNSTERSSCSRRRMIQYPVK